MVGEVTTGFAIFILKQLLFIFLKDKFNIYSTSIGY